MEYQEIQEYAVQEPSSEPQQQSPNNMATASLVMGILAMVTCFCNYLVVFFAGMGILFALLSRPEGSFSGQAKAGLILSVIALAAGGILWIVLAVFANLISDGAEGLQNLPVVPEIPDLIDPEHFLTILPWRGIGGVR